MFDFETVTVLAPLALMALVVPLLSACFSRNKRCYDTALEELLEIQSDWYVKVLLEEELNKIVRAARADLESDSEESEYSESEDCESEDCECESDCPCEGDCGGDCACVFTESESDSEFDSDSEFESASEFESESDSESESESESDSDADPKSKEDRPKKKTTVELLDEELEAVLANSPAHLPIQKIEATPKLRRRR